MNSHLRVSAALLALFAFSAYFAESVVAASACPPGMDVDGAPAAEIAEAAAHGGTQMAHHPENPPDEPADSGYDGPRCPLGMGGGGTCAAASFHLTRVVLRPSVEGREAAHLFLEDSHDRLVLASHFRPPRA